MSKRTGKHRARKLRHMSRVLAEVVKTWIRWPHLPLCTIIIDAAFLSWREHPNIVKGLYGVDDDLMIEGLKKQRGER